MKAKISEVWNQSGRTVVIAEIETKPSSFRSDVFKWIEENRPDLNLADTLTAHGFHAVAY